MKNEAWQFLLVGCRSQVDPLRAGHRSFVLRCCTSVPCHCLWSHVAIKFASVLRSEKIGYSIAVVVLVVGGALLRSALLNWIMGPSVVVGSVVLSNRLFGRHDTYEASASKRDVR